jgi:SAM-dependent methyltransferase
MKGLLDVGGEGAADARTGSRPRPVEAAMGAWITVRGVATGTGTPTAGSSLSRAGSDVDRDLGNTPALLAMLPDVTGRNGLGLGCGEGHTTRLLARRGAHLAAIDLAWRFLEAAVAEERREPLGIRSLRGSAVGLPFRSEAFDLSWP